MAQFYLFHWWVIETVLNVPSLYKHQIIVLKYQRIWLIQYKRISFRVSDDTLCSDYFGYVLSFSEYKWNWVESSCYIMKRMIWKFHIFLINYLQEIARLLVMLVTESLWWRFSHYFGDLRVTVMVMTYVMLLTVWFFVMLAIFSMY